MCYVLYKYSTYKYSMLPAYHTRHTHGTPQAACYRAAVYNTLLSRFATIVYIRAPEICHGVLTSVFPQAGAVNRIGNGQTCLPHGLH